VKYQTYLFFSSKTLLFPFFNRDQRAKPVIIDPALYSVNKSDLFWVTEKRNVPTAYKLFTGVVSDDLSCLNLYFVIFLIPRLLVCFFTFVVKKKIEN